MNEFEIFLRKRRKICISAPLGSLNPRIATFNRNLESVGFTLSIELLNMLSSASDEYLLPLQTNLISILKEIKGAHRIYEPMYPNFPKQVMEASDFELYKNAILHYIGSAISDSIQLPVDSLPKYEKADREKLSRKEISLEVISSGTHEEFNSIFTNIVGSNGSVSEYDKEIVQWFIKNRDYKTLLPKNIPSKENLAFIINATQDYDLFRPYIKTATDVLRLVVAMSEGDISLAEPTKFKRIPRCMRRYLLSLLEDMPLATEDMLRYKEYWKRLGRELRPGDYAKSYPKITESFKILRNDEYFQTYNSKMEFTIKYDLASALELGKTRPGDFARRLDHMLRVNPKEQEGIIREFAKVATAVSTPVLLQVYAHFKSRNKVNFRSFMPKGNVAKIQLTEEVLPKMDEGIIRTVCAVVKEALVKKFSKLPKLGDCYVDESLKQQIVPFAQRSASKALRTIVRGSKMPLPDSNIIRLFVWWKDGKDRTDIDLSAVLFGEDWKHHGDIGFYNLRNEAYGCCHSGDITSAPKGAAEFIDMDISKMLKNGIRYVVCAIYSYTQQPYCDLPECFGGWMSRQEAQSGEIFDPRTVQDRFDISSNTESCIPMVFDIVERKMIWGDISISGGKIYSSSGKDQSIARIGRSLVETVKPTLYDLFCMHVEARGSFSSRERADNIFSIHEGITPCDTTKIMSEYMGG